MSSFTITCVVRPLYRNALSDFVRWYNRWCRVTDIIYSIEHPHDESKYIITTANNNTGEWTLVSQIIRDCCNCENTVSGLRECIEIFRHAATLLQHVGQYRAYIAYHAEKRAAEQTRGTYEALAALGDVTSRADFVIQSDTFVIYSLCQVLRGELADPGTLDIQLAAQCYNAYAYRVSGTTAEMDCDGSAIGMLDRAYYVYTTKNMVTRSVHAIGMFIIQLIHMLGK